MGKSHLVTFFFPGLRRTASPISFGWLRATLKFKSSLTVLFLLAVTMLVYACGPGVYAQGRIIVLEKNKLRLPLPTTEVVRVARAGKEEAITADSMNLEKGDVLVAKSGEVTVKVVCNGSTQVTLSGFFRTRFLKPKRNGECNVLEEGKKDAGFQAKTGGPTHVKNGPVTMATAHTEYRTVSGARRRGLFGSDPPDVFVYEAAVTITSFRFSGVVKEGYKLVGGCNPKIKKLEKRDYLEAAEIYARVDASQIPDPKDLDAAFSKLVSAHQAVLENPRNQAMLIELKKTQEALGIPTSEIRPSDNQSPPEFGMNGDTSINQPRHRIKIRESRRQVRESGLLISRRTRT